MKYRMDQQLPNNELYFPSSFKISCGGKQKLGCKAYSIYQLDGDSDCYLLEKAVNEHCHRVDSQPLSKLFIDSEPNCQNDKLEYFTYIDPEL
jgi:hypothetical protein